MSQNSITKVDGNVVYVAGDDIDTDRIIPARFMKCITFDGLGEYLFYDVRYNEDGSPKIHDLNKAEFNNSTIMLSDNNFGCGSSREHAPQSIQKAGFKAIIAGSFAEIFFGNATNLGIVCICMSDQDRAEIVDIIKDSPNIEVSINLLKSKLFISEKSFDFTIKEGARKSLIDGSFDTLNELLESNSEIDNVVKGLGYF